MDRRVLRRISNRLNYSEISFGWARQSTAACLQSKVEFCLLQCIVTTFPFPLTAGSTISVHVVISNVDTIIFRAFQSNEIILKKNGLHSNQSKLLGKIYVRKQWHIQLHSIVIREYFISVIGYSIVYFANFSPLFDLLWLVFPFTWINNLFRLCSQRFLISFSGQIEQTYSIFPHLATIMVLNYRIVICWFFFLFRFSFIFLLLHSCYCCSFLVNWYFTAIDCMQLSI